MLLRELIKTNYKPSLQERDVIYYNPSSGPHKAIIFINVNKFSLTPNIPLTAAASKISFISSKIPSNLHMGRERGIYPSTLAASTSVSPRDKHLLQT